MRAEKVSEQILLVRALVGLLFENKVNWENLVAYRVRNNG
jgi:hypothetical protein